MKQLLLFFLLVFHLSSFSQQIELEGQYNGENLYVLNSTKSYDGFCVKSLTVNGEVTSDEINSSSFEIDLAQLKLVVGSPIKVILTYSEGCVPKVINPEAIKLKNSFTFKKVDITRSGMLSWSVEGDAGDEDFEIQQYRWDKWAVAGIVKMEDSVSFGRYSIETLPHYGQNIFRVCQIDKHGNELCSAEKKYRTIVKEIFLLSDKVGDELEFSYDTLYEIYSDDGELLISGLDSDVDVSELPKGNYWVNYDNKTELFVKK